MITFLHIMISLWVCGIIISIFSGCYVVAMLWSVLLLNTISDLRHEKEHEAIKKTIETKK